MDMNFGIAIAAAIAVFTGVGAAIGIGLATYGLVKSIARQPEASGKMTPLFFVGIALVESTAIYGLVIAILLIAKLG